MSPQRKEDVFVIPGPPPVLGILEGLLLRGLVGGLVELHKDLVVNSFVFFAFFKKSKEFLT